MGSDAAAAVARARGLSAGAGARRRAGPRPGHRRLEGALVDVLAGAGYEPEVSPGNGAILLHNCPYHALTANHRDLTCGMNLAWAQGILAGLGDPKLEAELAPAPGYCCVRFRT